MPQFKITAVFYFFIVLGAFAAFLFIFYVFYYVFWLFCVFGRSWGVLRRPWHALGVSGAHVECFGGLLGRSWTLLGRSWGLLEASQIDPKIDQKIDPKSSRIRDGPNRSGPTPADVSEGSERYRDLDPLSPQNYQSG